MNKQHNKNSVGIYEIQKTIHNLKIKNRRYPNQLFIRNTTTIPQTVVRHQTYHQGPLTKRRQNNSCPNFYEHKKQLGRTRSHFAEGMSFGRKTRRLIKKAKLKLEIFNTGAQVFRHLRLTLNPQWRLDTDEDHTGSMNLSMTCIMYGIVGFIILAPPVFILYFIRNKHIYNKLHTYKPRTTKQKQCENRK